MHFNKWLGVMVLSVLLTKTGLSQQLKLGNNPWTVEKSAALELQSTNQGLLFSRIADTTLINSLNPPDGMMIYFSPAKQLMLRANGSWQSLVTPGKLSAGTGIAYNNTTGVISNTGVLSVNGNTGALTMDTTYISNFYNKVRGLFGATGPITLTNGQIGITQASASTSGYLSSADWNTFNNKLANIDTTNIANFYIKSRSELSAGTGITYNNTTGVISNSGVTSVNGSTGALTMDTTFISNFYNKVRGLFGATGPITLTNGQIGITQASASTSGYLSSADWNTFNNKLANIDTTNISNFYIKSRSELSAGTGITYNNTTGVISNSGVTSVNGNTGALTMDTTYISNFYNKVRGLFGATGPITLTNGQIGITQASASTSGYLSSADWNTFNNKLANIDTTNIANFYIKSRSELSAGTGITYNNTTGVISNSGVTSVNGNTGALTMDTTFISNFYNKVRGLFGATGPITLTNGQIGISQASTSTSGYLSSADWNTFNNKLANIDTTNIANFYIKSRSELSAGTGITYNSTTGVIGNGGVTSVNGNTGALTMDTTFISNFYQKVRGLFSAGSGVTYNSTTGVISATASGSNWALGGNTVGAEKTLGTIDNFDLPFITNNTEKLRISNTGNVGIGSSTFNSTNPEKLLVNAGTTTSYNVIGGKGTLNNYLQLNIQNLSGGNAASSDVVATANNGDESSNYVDLGINSNGYSSTGILGGANNAYLYSTGNDFVIGNQTAGKNLLFFTGGSNTTNEAMRIDGSGHVGIGNTAPSEVLDITGNLKFSGALMPGGTAGTAGYILTSAGAGAAPTWAAPGTVSNSWLLDGNSVAAEKKFGTITNYALPFITNNTERMRISNTGNVAIGTSTFDATNPEKLVVNAGTTSSVNVIAGKGTLNNYLQLNIQNLSNGNTASSDVVATANNGSESINYVDMGINSGGYSSSGILGGANNAYLYSTGNDFVIGNQTAGKNLLFFTGGNAAGNEAMRIDGNGNVGIGVTNPANPLVVKDTLEIRRTGTLSELLFSNTAGTGDFRIGGDGGDIFWQGGGGRNLQMGSYWTTILGGDRQLSTFPAYSSGSSTAYNTGVLVLGQRDASVPLAVQANSATQSVSLTEWRNSSGTVLDAVDETGRLKIGTTSLDATNPEKLLVDAGTTSSFNVISGKGTINNYLQLNIQNRSNGNTASSDVVATADNGSESGNYIDMGINSSGFTNSTYPVLGGINNAYLYSTGNDFIIGNGTTGKSLRFFTGGYASSNEHLHIDGNGNVGIGTTSPVYPLSVEKSAGTVASFNRTSNDGTIISLQQAGVEEGTITVSGTTVSYNAFTGSHYSWCKETIEKGMLVTLTGENQYFHNNKNSEIIYGVRPSAQANDPKILGAFLGLQESSQPYSETNPNLVMAVGNGVMWVVDKGENMAIGDYLISSDVQGHAMKEDGTYPTAFVIARVAEPVDWQTETATFNGVKHKLISVFFESFVKNNAQKELESIKKEVSALKEMVKELQNAKKGN